MSHKTPGGTIKTTVDKHDTAGTTVSHYSSHPNPTNPSKPITTVVVTNPDNKTSHFTEHTTTINNIPVTTKTGTNSKHSPVDIVTIHNSYIPAPKTHTDTNGVHVTTTYKPTNTGDGLKTTIKETKTTSHGKQTIVDTITGSDHSHQTTHKTSYEHTSHGHPETVKTTVNTKGQTTKKTSAEITNTQGLKVTKETVTTHDGGKTHLTGQTVIDNSGVT